jgi:hypothetical protein
VLEAISTAMLFDTLDVSDTLDVPLPGGTESVQSTSTRCVVPVVPLITACG